VQLIDRSQAAAGAFTKARLKLAAADVLALVVAGFWAAAGLIGW
jgi:hypothetical protein